MAEEISFLSEEIQKICIELRKGIDGLSKLKKKPQERDEQVEQLQERISRAKDVYSQYRMELRDVLRECGRITYTEWEAKGHKHHQAITALAQELELFKANAAKADLMQGNTQQKKKDDANTWAGNEVISAARKVQDESKSSVARSAKLVEKMEASGMETSVALKAQSDQMRSINEDVQQVDQSLNRADKHLRDIARRLATDKMIMCLVLLLLLGIVGLVVAKAGNFIPGAGAMVDCGILETLAQCNKTKTAASVAQTPAPSTAPSPASPSPSQQQQAASPPPSSNAQAGNSTRRFLELESFAPFSANVLDASESIIQASKNARSARISPPEAPRIASNSRKEVPSVKMASEDKGMLRASSRLASEQPAKKISENRGNVATAAAITAAITEGATAKSEQVEQLGHAPISARVNRPTIVTASMKMASLRSMSAQKQQKVLHEVKKDDPGSARSGT